MQGGAENAEAENAEVENTAQVAGVRNARLCSNSSFAFSAYPAGVSRQ